MRERARGYPRPAMRPPGAFKISRRSRPEPSLHDPLGSGASRAARIIDSLRDAILSGGDEQTVRVRRVFRDPCEVYRIELENPEMRVQRTTLLDRDALEDLLEIDEVRTHLAADQRSARRIGNSRAGFGGARGRIRTCTA